LRAIPFYSFGQLTAIAIQRAMSKVRSEGCTDASLIAASDATGYCAIAVAQKGSAVAMEIHHGNLASITLLSIFLLNGRDR
jgi:hypothetical protein